MKHERNICLIQRCKKKMLNKEHERYLHECGMFVHLYDTNQLTEEVITDHSSSL